MFFLVLSPLSKDVPLAHGLGRGFTQGAHLTDFATVLALNLSRRDRNRAGLSLDKERLGLVIAFAVITEPSP
jgi:hypothetical protein